MARYHAGFTTSGTAAGAALVDFRTAATDRVRVLELGLFVTTAVQCLFSLERQTTLGTTSTTVVPAPGDVGEVAASLVIGTAWSVQPASTSVPIRRAQVSANIGAGVIWTFGFGDLIIPVSSSLVVLNRSASITAANTGYIVFDE